MTLAIIAANIQIDNATPRQREALIEMLVNGPLYRVGNGQWISRPTRTLFKAESIFAIERRAQVKIAKDDNAWNCVWARLTPSGVLHARASLRAWVDAVDRLVEDAALMGIVPEQLDGMAEKLAKLPEWKREDVS